jgi:PhnB protein
MEITLGGEMAKPIPDGYHTVTPYIIVRDAAKAIEFYKKAFGAEEVVRMPYPGSGKLMHAEIRVGDSMIMLSDESPEMGARGPETLGGASGSLMLYVDDVDAAFARALAAGCQVKMPVGDMFWGDRFGQVTDPFGHGWGLATHKEDVAPEEMDKRAQKWFAQMAAGGQG